MQRCDAAKDNILDIKFGFSSIYNFSKIILHLGVV